MTRLSTGTRLVLVFDILLLIACALHIPTLLQRPAAPFRLTATDGSLTVTRILDQTASPTLRPGDKLLTWNRVVPEHPGLLEFLTDFEAIGEVVPITYVSEGSPPVTVSVRLIPAYSAIDVLIFTLVGLVTWCVGVYVLLKSHLDFVAWILHWAMMAMATVVIMAWEGGTVSDSLGFLDTILFFLSYVGVASLFFLFTAMFPRSKPGSPLAKALVIFLPAVAVCVPVLFSYGRAALLYSAPDFLRFLRWFSVFHAVIILFILGGLVNFIISYATSTTSQERKKLKWMMWGLCTGPTPFVLLTLFPHVTGWWNPAPEALTLFPLILIPVAFGISFIRHRILDIEVVINRTTVYAIVVGMVYLGYSLLVAAVAALVGSMTVEISAAAAVLVALAFNPVRARVQRFVDRRFFRVQYNFRKAEREFVEDIKRCLDTHELARLIVNRADRLIPVERIGFFSVTQPGTWLHLVAHHGFDLLEKRAIRFRADQLRSRLRLPVALGDRLEPGIEFESADEKVFRRWGMALVFPMLSEKEDVLGFLVLGERRSDARFTHEDVDLLNNVAAQAGLAMERVRLLGQLVLKEAETQRLEELNKLKSDFVSYVSHELRTPLTSIKMFTELLRARQRKPDTKTAEFLRVIEGETDRLDRMVSTILDAAKIDRGVKQYEFTPVDLREIVDRVLSTMQYQLEKHCFAVRATRPKRSLTLQADADAVAQALINLIANAIKYSGTKRYLRVTLARRNGWAECRVQDHGLGIAAESLPHLFEQFYRDPAHKNQAKGIGLGLPLVRHIMDAHGGTVAVESTVGKGSTFTLRFPLDPSSHDKTQTHPRR